MKKIGILFFGLIFLLSCNSKENSDMFVLSNYYKKDTTEFDLSKVSQELEPEPLPLYNPNYIMGNYHFLIFDEKIVYFYTNPNWKSGTCLTGADFRQDSIDAINFNINSMKSIRPIKLDSIEEIILKANLKIKDESWNRNVFSFAQFSDTLKGNFMNEIIKNLEKDNKNRFFIRLMNPEEIQAVENFEN